MARAHLLRMEEERLALPDAALAEAAVEEADPCAWPTGCASPWTW
ncbi:hypothetical protein ACFSYD_07805 [Paracoccus aerius]